MSSSEESGTPNSRERSLGQLLRALSNKLQEDQSQEAVRLFLNVRDRAGLGEDELLRRVVSVLGQDQLAKLVLAFAHFPCPACDGGLDQCDLCDGEGTRAEGLPCDPCAGIGQVRCDFCDGSGLATYNLVPSRLRVAVLAHRVTMASREVEALVQHPMAPASGDASSWQQYQRRLLNLNKLLGVLENAVVTSKPMAEQDPRAAHRLEEITRACHLAASAANQHLRRVLSALAANASQTAQHEQEGSPAARLALAQAEFYDRLSREPAFERTMLHHPFLVLPPSV